MPHLPHPIRMKRTVPGALTPTGPVRTYEAGKTYRLPDHGPLGLRAVFLRQGWAEEVLPEVPAETLTSDADYSARNTDAAEGTAENPPTSDPELEEEPADSLTPHRCQAVTGTGEQCKRDAAPSSDYCTISAHQAQGEEKE